MAYLLNKHRADAPALKQLLLQLGGSFWPKAG